MSKKPQKGVRGTYNLTPLTPSRPRKDVEGFCVARYCHEEEL